MNFLIGCEESQAVTIELRKLGINAFSCDLKRCSGGYPEWHLQMDIFEAINGGELLLQNGETVFIDKWMFTGLHPVCTKMTLSGNRHYAPGKLKHFERLDSVEWTINLWNYACSVSDHVYMENPLGAMNGDKRLPKPQIIQPYYFGDEARKTTCLWLYNLPFLNHFNKTDLFNDKITHVGDGGSRKLVKSDRVFSNWAYEMGCLPISKRAEARSKTFPGIAKAMATQWSEFILNKQLETA